jgi:hypothetical protein
VLSAIAADQLKLESAWLDLSIVAVLDRLTLLDRWRRAHTSTLRAGPPGFFNKRVIRE